MLKQYLSNMAKSFKRNIQEEKESEDLPDREAITKYVNLLGRAGAGAEDGEDDSASNDSDENETSESDNTSRKKRSENRHKQVLTAHFV